jgi:PAS domain S-box-containing protein
MMTTFFLFAAVTVPSGGSSALPFLVAIIVALIGSGGIGYFIDRRSMQASRLAADAVSATAVFKDSLEEERRRRANLEEELREATTALHEASQQAGTNALLIDALHRRIEALERDLLRSLQDIVFASDEACEILGYRCEDLHGTSLIRLIPDNDREKYLGAFLKAGEAESHDQLVPPFRVGMKRKDGGTIHVALALGSHGETVTLILRTLSAEESSGGTLDALRAIAAPDVSHAGL